MIDFENKEYLFAAVAVLFVVAIILTLNKFKGANVMSELEVFYNKYDNVILMSSAVLVVLILIAILHHYAVFSKAWNAITALFAKAKASHVAKAKASHVAKDKHPSSKK